MSDTPTSSDWNRPFDTLRKKWGEVPVTKSGRRKTSELLALPDAELIEVWEQARREITTGEQFQHRGWYHALYSPILAGKKVMDVGSGFAVDSITFARAGARLTFVDIEETNLKVVERLCRLFNVPDPRFVHLKDLDVLKSLDTDYDVIMAMGSLHHAPQSVIKPETAELLKHLKPGGRWLQLAYPKTRWIRNGRLPFDRWGARTDGEGTPWGEWYDMPKLLALLHPARFDVVLHHEFIDSKMNWFDLIFRGFDPSVPPPPQSDDAPPAAVRLGFLQRLKWAIKFLIHRLPSDGRIQL